LMLFGQLLNSTFLATNCWRLKKLIDDNVFAQWIVEFADETPTISRVFEDGILKMKVSLRR
jgi:hypothetical protein